MTTLLVYKAKTKFKQIHLDMGNFMSKEARKDHFFEPPEEYPRQYRPPGVEEWMPLYNNVIV